MNDWGLTLSIAGLSVTLLVHLIGTVWWASRLTARVEHIEKWIGMNEQTGARLSALEALQKQSLETLGRIEDKLKVAR